MLIKLKMIAVSVAMFSCCTVAVNAQVKEVQFPTKYKFNGNDVIMISPLQVRKINKVFLDNENNQRKVLSLNKEIEALSQIVWLRDSVIVYKDEIIKTERDKEKIYTEQIRTADVRYETVVKTKDAEIKRAKRKGWIIGGVSVGIGIGIGALIGIL